MAYTLLDGSDATIDMKVALTGSTPDKSMRCFASTLSFALRRTTQSKTTFCGNGWVDVTPTNKQMFGVVGGFSSKGDVLSDPLAMMVQTPLPFAGTFTTGCSLSGNLVVTEDANTVVAAANSGRTIAWESSGAVTSLWVVA